MDEKRTGSSFILNVLREFRTIFTMIILLLTFGGKLVVRYIPDLQEVSTLFTSDGAGMSYSVILQFAGIAVILAIVSAVLSLERVQSKISYWRRSFFLLLATLVSISVFSLVFGYFPTNSIRMWLGFLLPAVICFAVAIGLSLLILKLEKKNYNRLLANYKARNNLK